MVYWTKRAQLFRGFARYIVYLCLSSFLFCLCSVYLFWRTQALNTFLSDFLSPSQFLVSFRHISGNTEKSEH